MASYAPLFVNTNDRRWNPDAIVYDSSRVYGTPSYWMQLYFAKSSGATLLKTALQASSSASLVASAISWKSATDNKDYITVKV
jgi:alpha-L-arabinofuranosidase